MADHPEFPQESKAIQYIVDKVSTIEDIRGCSAGYYASAAKILGRLDKTDNLLNQLSQTNTAIRRITDSDAVAAMVGRKSDEINQTLRKGLDDLLLENVKSVTACLTGIQHDNKKICMEFTGLIYDVQKTNAELRNQIAAVDGCLVIPAWQALIGAVVLFVVGAAVGKVI